MPKRSDFGAWRRRRGRYGWVRSRCVFTRHRLCSIADHAAGRRRFLGGGKTAVDLSHGKNLCGAFHQPKLVLCDTNTFKTLAPLQWQDGLAEMLKYGVICDKTLFEQIQNYKNENLEALIARCVEIKRDIVSADEFDHGKRQLLNLGHTVGHAVEAASNFSITHGHAVAIGMAVIARGAQRLQMAEPGTAAHIERALDACALPSRCDFDADTLASLTLSDKKSDGDFINLIIPERIGGSVIRKKSRVGCSKTDRRRTVRAYGHSN